MAGNVAKVKSNSSKKVNYIIGDANIEDICHVGAHRTSFFKLLGKNLRSITHIDNWGESSGGITHPTVQYSSKGSRLGDHVEHYNFASVNLYHHGSIKQWNVRPGCDYIPSLQTMYNNQSGLNLQGFKGVCESTLTHRDIWFNPNIHEKPSEVINQEPGDVIIVHPSAIHNVINLGVNLAESMNVLPSSLFITNICTYKTCEHSEGLNGKPNFNYVEELKQKFDEKVFIHESDPNKQLKINIINNFKDKKDNQYLKEAIKHIKNSHLVPQWFHDLKLDPNVEEITSYECDKCKYHSVCYSNFMRHYNIQHGKPPPKRLTCKECPQCGKYLKDLSAHILKVHQ